MILALRVKLLTMTSGFAVVDSGLMEPSGKFDPAQDFSGDITFNYTVTDGETDPVAASATLHVAEVPDAPVIEGDMSGSVTEDLSLTAHGTLTITDPDTARVVSRLRRLRVNTVLLISIAVVVGRTRLITILRRYSRLLRVRSFQTALM